MYVLELYLGPFKVLGHFNDQAFKFTIIKYKATISLWDYVNFA